MTKVPQVEESAQKEEAQNSQTLAVVVDEDLPIVGRVLHRPAQLVVVVSPLNLLKPLLLVEFAKLRFPRHRVVGPG
jgi:hypothetical protein